MILYFIMATIFVMVVSGREELLYSGSWNITLISDKRHIHFVLFVIKQLYFIPFAKDCGISYHDIQKNIS